MTAIVAMIDSTIINTIQVQLQSNRGVLTPNHGVINQIIPPVTPNYTKTNTNTNNQVDKENIPDPSTTMNDQLGTKHLLADALTMTE